MQMALAKNAWPSAKALHLAQLFFTMPCDLAMYVLANEICASIHPLYFVFSAVPKTTAVGLIVKKTTVAAIHLGDSVRMLYVNSADYRAWGVFLCTLSCLGREGDRLFRAECYNDPDVLR